MPQKRKQSQRKPLPTLRIFCEGECTEPNYLKGYIASLDDRSRKSVIEIAPTRKNTAIQLVEDAIAAKKSSQTLPEDEFWVVYDRESVAKYPDHMHAKARAKAVKAGINIALCNVCFEYWLLIHLVDTDAPYTSFDNLIGASPLKAQMKAKCGCDYEKSQRAIFDNLKPFLPQARERAKSLNAKGVASAGAGLQQHQINPYVGIVDLLDAIDAFI